MKTVEIGSKVIATERYDDGDLGLEPGRVGEVLERHPDDHRMLLVDFDEPTLASMVLWEDCEPFPRVASA